MIVLYILSTVAGLFCLYDAIMDRYGTDTFDIDNLD